MSLNPLDPPKPRDGDYVVTRMMDTLLERDDCERQLARNGCKAVRFEVRPDGVLVAHGYLRAS